MVNPTQTLLARLAAAELTRMQVRCLSLHYYDGLAQRAIAQRLGIHRSVVARHISAGRRKLAAAGMKPRRTYTAETPRIVTMDIDALDALGGVARAVW